MAKKVQTPPKSFEDALRELEQILTEIEGGEMGLEESLLKYERGNFLIQHCRGVLNNAEKQIDLLGKSPDGGLASSSYPLPAPEAVVVADRGTADRAGEPKTSQGGQGSQGSTAPRRRTEADGMEEAQAGNGPEAAGAAEAGDDRDA